MSKTLTAAEQLAVSMHPPLNYAAILRLAKAYLTDPAQGDFTPAHVYEWVSVSNLDEAELATLEAELEALRQAHFEALGQPVPAHAAPIR